MEELFVVRLYDGFDNDWMDVSKSLPYKEAFEIWNKKTKDGTKNTNFGDIDYYKIFPADTVMKYSTEAGYVPWDERK